MLDIEERKIPLTPGVDPLDLLTNDGNNAKMTSEGLPADRISLENGSIITNCKRWPLIIDPQQQVSRRMDLFGELKTVLRWWDLITKLHVVYDDSVHLQHCRDDLGTK